MNKATLVLAVVIAVFCQLAVPADPTRDPLDKKITCPGGRDTFQRRIDFISKETGVSIVIDGASLQQHGITRNQNTVIDESMANTPAVLLIASLCRQIETKTATIVIRREDDGSVMITAKRP